MSDILESSAVITVKKILINLQNSIFFVVLPKMLQVVYQSDLNKLCQSNIKEYNGIIYIRHHLLVFSEKKIKMLKTAFVTTKIIIIGGATSCR